MPNRHRNHELETLSQRAFESAMPANLVVRPVSDDYGVDREAEVFDGDNTTGLTFKVQLKGTDKSGTTRRITRDHIEYWLSLDVPVLLVSYEAGTEILRGRWVHSIDMDEHKSGAATITVHMDPQIDLHGNWTDTLDHDLQLIREVRRGRLPKPMPLRVTVEDGATSISNLQISAALLKASRGTDHPMAITVGLLAEPVPVATFARSAPSSTGGRARPVAENAAVPLVDGSIRSGTAADDTAT